MIYELAWGGHALRRRRAVNALELLELEARREYQVALEGEARDPLRSPADFSPVSIDQWNALSAGEREYFRRCALRRLRSRETLA